MGSESAGKYLTSIKQLKTVNLVFIAFLVVIIVITVKYTITSNTDEEVEKIKIPLVPHFAFKEEKGKKEFKYVTGASANHYHVLKILIGSALVHVNNPIIVYDLGLAKEQKADLVALSENFPVILLFVLLIMKNTLSILIYVNQKGNMHGNLLLS